MPTAAKLVAAVAFALVGWLAALAYIPQLPEGTGTGSFPEITAGIGFLLGWLTMGPNVGRGYKEALSYGLRTSIFLVFWTLFIFSIVRMISRSTKMQYHNAGEAVLDVPMQMLEYARLLPATEIVVTLVIGGILGGLVTEFARKWR